MAFEGLLISGSSLIQLIVRKQLKLIFTYQINKTIDAVYHNALFQGHSSFTNVLYPLKNLKTLESIVNTELHNLFNWLTSNKLAQNIKNSNFVIFRPHQKKLSYQPKINVFDDEKQKIVSLEQRTTLTHSLLEILPKNAF